MLDETVSFEMPLQMCVLLVFWLWKAAFLICCAPVNSCSVTSMTAVHFLHQTDIGLALRKHKVIYSISPTLFSPSHSLPLYLSPSRVFAFLLCKQDCGVKCVTRAGLTCPFSFPSLNLSCIFSPSLALHDSLLLLFHCCFPPLSHLHPPSPLFLSLPHSLSVFSFAQLFCCRFDRYD